MRGIIDAIVFIFLFRCVSFLFAFAYIGGYEALNIRNESNAMWCCYFGQHYHNCYTGKAGCDIGSAIAFVENRRILNIGNGVQVIKCHDKLECPGLLEAGFFLRGFRQGCQECNSD